MRWMLFAGVASLAACGSNEPRFVGWPQVDADTLSFIVETRDGTRTVHGPFSAAGPESRVQIEDGGLSYLISLPTAWLRSVHPRVDADRLEETRLVSPPSSCSACAGACRTESDASIFHPIGDVGQSWQLDEAGFTRVAAAPLGALHVELPARWVCKERTLPLERLEEWPRDANVRGLHRLPDGRFVLLGGGLRIVGAPDEVAWSFPGGGMHLRSLANIGDRVFAAAGVPGDDESPGSIVELAIDGDEVRAVRISDVPFSPGEIEVDERGLVVAGRGGEVATSTDGVHFDAERLPFGLGLASLGRVGDPRAPYLFGGSRGSIVRGDPWVQPREWTFEYVATTDSSISRIVAIEADVDHPRLILAKTVERGAHVQEVGRPWEKIEFEVPATYGLCTQAADGCGFTLINEKMIGFEARGRSVLATARNCPVLFVVHVDDGCASSVELRTEGGLVDEGGSIALAEDGALVVVPDGVLRVPLDGL